MRTFLEVVDRMKEIQRIDSNKPQQDLAAKQRAERNAASKKRVADKEASARVLPPDKDQAAKDREARKAAANKQVAEAERKARPITSKSSRLGGTGGRKTMTSTARPANTMSKPKSRPVTTATAQTNNPAKTPKDNVAGSADRLKSQSTDTKSEYDKAKESADIQKKLANRGKTYRDLKSVGKAFMKPGKTGEDVETGKEAGNVSGGSEYVSRTKRG